MTDNFTRAEYQLRQRGDVVVLSRGEDQIVLEFRDSGAAQSFEAELFALLLNHELIVTVPALRD